GRRGVGFLDRLFSRSTGNSSPKREMAAWEVQAAAAEDSNDDLIELEVVGESQRQEALAKLTGPKCWDGYETHVGVTLRCEPKNEYDANAVRVEAMGQLVGYVARDKASVLSQPMQNACRGVIEARGLIVGGWDRGDGDEGHYGIRVWI